VLDLTAPPVRAVGARRYPIFVQTAGGAVRSALLWGVIFGIVVTSSAVSYTKVYATQGERAALARAFGANDATAALFGPAPHLQSVAGFVVFKSFMTIMILGALWALMTTTRLLRGEEDAGRWDLLLCGQVTPRRATAQALAAFGVAVVGLWLVTAVFSVGTGRLKQVGIAPSACLYFALAQVASAAMFVEVGALASQLAPTRRQAAALAGWFLGGAYLLRMVADAGIGLHQVIWVSPLGWVEELQPLTAPQPLAFLPIICFTAVAAGVTVILSGIRDTGGSTLLDRARAPARVRLLSGQFALSARLLQSTAIAWLCAVSVTGVVLGLVAKEAGETIAGSSVQEVFTRLGAAGTGVSAFLGVAFLIAAVLVAFLAAGQATAASAEEAEGRFANLAVAPISRGAWLGGRVILGVGLSVAAGLLTGIGAWLGAAAEGSGMAFTSLLVAGANVAPPALCLLGIGFLAMGVRPSWTTFAVYGVLGWSLLVELIGGFGSSSRWLLDLSLFHQMAAAPAASPNWGTSAVLMAIGAVCAIVGLLAFGRRDLAGV
jgi:ABC-2 type transport system permease protein